MTDKKYKLRYTEASPFAARVMTSAHSNPVIITHTEIVTIMCPVMPNRFHKET